MFLESKGSLFLEHSPTCVPVKNASEKLEWLVFHRCLVMTHNQQHRHLQATHNQHNHQLLTTQNQRRYPRVMARFQSHRPPKNWAVAH